jgi:hypothetical protein
VSFVFGSMLKRKSHCCKQVRECLHTSRLVSQEQGVVLAGFAVDGPHARG